MIDSANAQQCQILSVQSRHAHSDSESFCRKQLLVARMRLQGVDKALRDELLKPSPEPQRVDKLAAAWQRLSEVERVLDGRPMPGSRRPERQSTPRRAKVEPE